MATRVSCQAIVVLATAQASDTPSMDSMACVMLCSVGMCAMLQSHLNLDFIHASSLDTAKRAPFPLRSMLCCNEPVLSPTSSTGRSWHISDHAITHIRKASGPRMSCGQTHLS